MDGCLNSSRGVIFAGSHRIVDDRVTGALAEPFDPASLAAAIRWLLEDSKRRQQLGVAARSRAERLWCPGRVAGQYAEIYEKAIAA